MPLFHIYDGDCCIGDAEAPSEEEAAEVYAREHGCTAAGLLAVPATPRLPQAPKEVSPHECLLLLLVEPLEEFSALMRQSLEDAGHRVTTCTSAGTALTVVRHLRFDLILLDQALPESNGVELLQVLRQRGLETPAIILAAWWWNCDGLGNRALRAGALDFIEKDNALTFLAELPRRVGEAVARSQAKARAFAALTLPSKE